MSPQHTVIGEERKACQTKMLTGFSFKSFDVIRRHHTALLQRSLSLIRDARLHLTLDASGIFCAS